MKIYLLYSLFISLILSSTACNYSSLTAKKSGNLMKDSTVVIIKNIDKKISDNKINLNFYYQDSLFLGTGVYLEQDTTKLFINGSTWLIHSDSLQSSYLIYSGDTIYLSMNKDSSLYFHVLNDTVRNNELAFFQNLIHRTGILYNYFFDNYFGRKLNNPESLNEFYNTISQKEAVRLQILDSSYKKGCISNSFYLSAVNIIRYTALNDRLYAIAANRKMLERNNLYEQKLDSCKREIKELPYSSDYMCHRLLIELVSLSVDNFLNAPIKDINDLKSRINFILLNLSGEQRNFLLSNQIAHTFLYERLNIPKEILKQYDSSCSSDAFKQLLHKKIDNQYLASDLGKDNALLSSDGRTTITIDKLISNNKGKVILLDFWASWCGPCIAQISYLKQLRKKYSTDKLLIFSLSLDSKIDDWEKAMKEYNLLEPTSYLLNKNSSFTNKYKISYIPRYMLIGKDGNIISADAPRPSDPKLKELIDKYVE